MGIFVAISQAILYISLAILMGTFILRIVPKQFRPSFTVSNKWIIVSAISIPIATFIPVLNIVLYIAPRLGFMRSFEVVLMQYSIGLAWAATFLLSSVLIFMVIVAKSQQKTEHKGMNVLFTLIVLYIIVTIAWASHATAINMPLGIISDSLHLLAVSIWVGIVFVLAWFATNYNNWSAFLTWFSIVAISCLGATAISGFLMLDVLVDDYVDSWMVSYGQGLFIKHLLILPLIFYAAINGLFVKFKIGRDANFNPSVGVRVESLLLLSIFLITAYFTQAAPPHGHYLTEEAVSPLFLLMHDSLISSGSTLSFISNPIAIAFVFGCMLFFGLNVIGYFKRLPVWLLFIFSLLFTGMIYMTFMLSVSIN